MKRPPIRSRRDEARPEPWADLLLADGSLDVQVRELNGLLVAREHAAERAGQALDKATRNKLEQGRRPNATSHTFELDADADDEVHVLAQTLDGDLEFVPESKQRPEYYAHLAWFDPSTGEWTALEFVDPTDAA